MPTSRREFRTQKRQCRQRADEGIGPYAKGYHYCAQGWTLRRARCPHRAANFGRRNDSAGGGPMRASAPTQKGIIVAPRVGLCVGRDAHIAPRIPDAETIVPATGHRGPPALGKIPRKKKRGRLRLPHLFILSRITLPQQPGEPRGHCRYRSSCRLYGADALRRTSGKQRRRERTASSGSCVSYPVLPWKLYTWEQP